MLNMAVRNTGKLIREKSKSENIRLGRLFTKKDTAKRMADMLSLSKDKSVYTVLDPGAGTGILSAAVIEAILILRGYLQKKVNSSATERVQM